MNCLYCGGKLPTEAAFCPACGSPIVGEEPETADPMTAERRLLYPGAAERMTDADMGEAFICYPDAVVLHGELTAQAYDKAGLDERPEVYDALAADEMQALVGSLEKVMIPDEKQPAKINWNC